MPSASAMKVAELRSELEKRGLDTKGLKADLVARFTQALASEQTQSPQAAAAPAASPSEPPAQPEPTVETESSDSDQPIAEAAPVEEVPEPEAPSLVQPDPVPAVDSVSSMEIAEPAPVHAVAEQPSTEEIPEQIPQQIAEPAVEAEQDVEITEAAADPAEDQSADPPLEAVTAEQAPVDPDTAADKSDAEPSATVAAAEKGPDEEDKPAEEKPPAEEAEVVPPENDGPQEWEEIEIPDSWLHVPCVRISNVPKGATEEDLTEMLKTFGTPKSVVFTESPDVVLARITPSEGDEEALAKAVSEAMSGESPPVVKMKVMRPKAKEEPAKEEPEAPVKDEAMEETKEEVTEAKEEVAEVKEEVAEVKEEVAEMKEEVTEVKEDVPEVKQEDVQVEDKDPVGETTAEGDVEAKEEAPVPVEMEETTQEFPVRIEVVPVPGSLLFIGNLGKEVDDAKLREMFESHGALERCFVMVNKEGVSKGYGFVEFSLRSDAAKARSAVFKPQSEAPKEVKEADATGAAPPTPPETRPIRADFSEAKTVTQMFSATLFVDVLPKGFNNQRTLKNLFLAFGKIKAVHIAAFPNGTPRGFAFVDFLRSDDADAARHALDGSELESTKIRVQYGNPVKASQQQRTGAAKTNKGGKGNMGNMGNMMRPGGFPMMGGKGNMGKGMGRGPMGMGGRMPFMGNQGMMMGGRGPMMGGRGPMGGKGMMGRGPMGGRGPHQMQQVCYEPELARPLPSAVLLLAHPFALAWREDPIGSRA
ncbi:hypothetical protein CYMTET_22545 [Cymbomonas tetramitiformis]|uniref:Uncharacterized protein n=1 Tax=Cymbomonas tetramitiformis TaxID=36881 RepID=A0AAE0G129_9CHLO|nr:hypothetical protein CYMTET_22545 [Cymbomonas tetramitiformis]